MEASTDQQGLSSVALREAVRPRHRNAGTAGAASSARPPVLVALAPRPASGTTHAESLAFLKGYGAAGGGLARGGAEDWAGPAAPMRVGVVDADPAHAADLAAAIAGEPALEVAGTASSFDGGLRLARSGLDLLLVDCRLADGGAPRLARTLRREAPGVLVVGLSTRLDRASRAALVAEGAVGAVDRAMPPEDVAMVVREAFAGPALLRLAHA